jgi:hypothetical protein
MEKTGDEHMNGCGCNKERQSPKGLQKLWEYLFAPWEITVHNRGADRFNNWKENSLGHKVMGTEYVTERNWIEYKYSHKFRKEEKIVKEYID